MEKVLPPEVWSLSLDEKNRLLWSGLKNGVLVTYTKEPMTNVWDRLKAGLYRMLPIRSQL